MKMRSLCLLFSVAILLVVMASTATSFIDAQNENNRIEQILRDNLNVQPTANSPSAERMPSLDDMSEEDIIRFLASQQQQNQETDEEKLERLTKLVSDEKLKRRKARAERQVSSAELDEYKRVYLDAQRMRREEILRHQQQRR